MSVSYPGQWPPQQPPPQQPQQPPQYPQQWPPPYPPPPYPPPAPRKTNRALIVVLAVVAVVVLIPAALIGFFVIRDIAHDGLDGRGGTKKATALSDFDVVCDRGSISNAAAYGKPYKIAAFAPDERPSPMSQVTSDHWRELTLDMRADYRASPNGFASTNVVACLTHKPGTEAKSLTCKFTTDQGENVTVDYYSLQYNIELREARTGKRIEQLGSVDGPATRCPSLLWVNKRELKMYAEPDDAAVNAKLAEFADR